MRAFVNTLELEDALDELGDPAALKSWLVARGLLGERERATEADLRRIVEVREALRVLLLANNGVVVEADKAMATLDRAARRAGLSVRFHSDGSSAVEPAAGGPDGAIGRILAIVAAEMGGESWRRLKACRADDCHWAFYDHAKNRSRAWCSMRVCGNRTKARRYRQRHSA